NSCPVIWLCQLPPASCGDGRQLWNSLRASPSSLPFHAFDTVEIRFGLNSFGRNPPIGWTNKMNHGMGKSHWTDIIVAVVDDACHSWRRRHSNNVNKKATPTGC
ncbi:unnamed protein product, partial [Musa acuminata var. zebrina]